MSGDPLIIIACIASSLQRKSSHDEVPPLFSSGLYYARPMQQCSACILLALMGSGQTQLVVGLAVSML
jgi:hypothetical protein